MSKRTPTQFYHTKKEDGIVTRSGLAINCEHQTEFFKNVTSMVEAIKMVNVTFDAFKIWNIGVASLQGDSILDELYTRQLNDRNFKAKIDKTPRYRYAKIEWIPEFIRTTLVTTNLCRICLNNDLFIALLTTHKSQLRKILLYGDRWEAFRGQMYRKLCESRDVLHKIYNHDEQRTCNECKKYQERGLQITSNSTTIQRIQKIDEFLQYFISPSSAAQAAYFRIVSYGIPQDVAKNILTYV